MRGLMLAAVAAVVCLAGETRAGDEVRLTIDLEWHHLPRNSKVESRQSARLPGASVEYWRYTNGVRSYAISFDDGVTCSTYAGENNVVALECGRKRNAFFDLTQAPGRQAKVEWVTYGDMAGVPPGGEVARDQDKPKVRL